MDEHEQDGDLAEMKVFSAGQITNNVEQHNRNEMKRTRTEPPQITVAPLLMSEKEARLTNGDSCLGPTRSKIAFTWWLTSSLFPTASFFSHGTIISINSSAKPAKKRGRDLHLPAPN